MSAPPPTSSAPFVPIVSERRAHAMLAVLFLINLANYIDRFLVIGLAPYIKDEFKVGDAAVGWLTTSFIFVYMVASPLAGYLSDRLPRGIVVATSLVLWSCATALASKSPSYLVLLVTRAFVGVGEAGYAASGSALLTDVYPEERRSRVIAIFNAAIPIGGAIGYLLAGYLGKHMDWRDACLYVGASGLFLAPLALILRAPRVQATGEGGPGSTLGAYLALVRDRIYVTNTLGMAMFTFAVGAISQWAEFWLEHAHEIPRKDAALYTGAIAAGSGFVGTVLGMVVADALGKRSLIPSYAWVTGAGYAVALPFLALGLFVGPTWLALGCLFVGMTGAFMGTGPSNAIISLRAAVEHRATAFALNVFLIHFLGDAASPILVGVLADTFRERGASEGATYARALLLAPLAMGLAAVAMALCARAGRSEPDALAAKAESKVS